MRAKAANRFALMSLGIALALLYAAPARMNSAAIAAAPGQPIAGIQCERQEYGDFHIHAHLDIFVDSRPYAIPALIGIPAGVEVLTTKIYLQIKGGLIPKYGEASAYSIILIVLVALGLIPYYRITSKTYKFTTISGKNFRPTRIQGG